MLNRCIVKGKQSANRYVSATAVSRSETMINDGISYGDSVFGGARALKSSSNRNSPAFPVAQMDETARTLTNDAVCY